MLLHDVTPIWQHCYQGKNGPPVGTFIRPDDVKVVEVKGAQNTIYEPRVSKSDVGKVIGKRGKTVNAVRTILSGVSAKKRTHCILEIVE